MKELCNTFDQQIHLAEVVTAPFRVLIRGKLLVVLFTLIISVPTFYSCLFGQKLVLMALPHLILKVPALASLDPNLLASSIWLLSLPFFFSSSCCSIPFGLAPK